MNEQASWLFFVASPFRSLTSFTFSLRFFSGVTHGLILLPVLLSYFGGRGYASGEEENEVRHRLLRANDSTEYRPFVSDEVEDGSDDELWRDYLCKWFIRSFDLIDAFIDIWYITTLKPCIQATLSGFLIVLRRLHQMLTLSSILKTCKMNLVVMIFAYPLYCEIPLSIGKRFDRGNNKGRPKADWRLQTEPRLEIKEKGEIIDGLNRDFWKWVKMHRNCPGSKRIDDWGRFLKFADPGLWHDSSTKDLENESTS